MLEKKDTTGCEGAYLELLQLRALRYLGWRMTFDDNKEYTALSEEAYFKFFHAFVKIGSTVLFENISYLLQMQQLQRSTCMKWGRQDCMAAVDQWMWPTSFMKETAIDSNRNTWVVKTVTWCMLSTLQSITGGVLFPLQEVIWVGGMIKPWSSLTSLLLGFRMVPSWMTWLLNCLR